MLKYSALNIFLLLIFSGCTIGKGSFTAHPSKTKVSNNSLRLNGNYTGVVKGPSEKKGLMVFCLYSTGVALEYYFDSTANNNSCAGKEIIISDILYQDSLYKGVKAAGGFVIEKDKITIQVFEFVNNGMFEICTYTGNIINDTAIYISSCYIKSKSNFCPSQFYLSFCEMKKTDSTNQFINKKWYWKKE